MLRSRLLHLRPSLAGFLLVFFVATLVHGQDCIDYDEFLYVESSLETNPSGKSIALMGDYAYLVGWDAFEVVDISDPASPMKVGEIDTMDFTMGVAVAGDYAYVGNHFNSFQVIDVSNPSLPSFKGSLDLSDNVRDIAIVGDHAYVANVWDLRVIDSAELRLVAKQDGRERIISFDKDDSGRFTAVDGSSSLVGESEVTYSLYYLGMGSEWQLLAQETLGLSDVPSTLQLLTPRPNPFNPVTVIPFNLDRRQHVTISIHDLYGRNIVRLLDRMYSAGPSEVPWDGRDAEGRMVSSGTYLVKMQTAGGILAHKLVLLK